MSAPVVTPSPVVYTDLRPGPRCIAGEFESQAAIILGCHELEQIFPRVMVDVIAALIHRIPIIALVSDEVQRRQVVTQLSDWGLPAHQMHFVNMPERIMWVRDYGPQFVRKADGTVVILDPFYPHADRRWCDDMPQALAELLRVPLVKVPLHLEGGNLLSNGQGLCITTAITVRHNLDYGGLTPPQIGWILKNYYGFEHAIVMDSLYGEKTCHVDVFATFTSADTVVIGEYDRRIDPVNADILDRNAARLSGIITPTGPLKVERIPMPDNRGGVWRTYTNVIYANGTLLMPVYPGIDPEGEQKAMETYSRLLPGWEIKPIDSGQLIQNAGALRCVSANVPWLDHLFEVPRQGPHRQVA